LSLNGYLLERTDGQDIIQAQIVENGSEHALHGCGEGALSAFIDGWAKRSGQRVSVVDYNEHAIGSGTDAEAVAYVQLNIGGQRVSGVAFDHDTVSASLKAVLSALNRSLVEAVA
jgi:2-isopropylmalate synthase